MIYLNKTKTTNEKNYALNVVYDNKQHCLIAAVLRRYVAGLC